MRGAFRRRYGHGAARVPLAGSAPRWSTREQLGHTLRPIVSALLGCALMLLALPWLVPTRERDAYVPLDLALVVESPPQAAPEPDANVAPQDRASEASLASPGRPADRPVLPRMAGLDPLPAVPDAPAIRARRTQLAPQAGRTAVRADIGFARTPAPTLAPVSAPPSRATRSEAPADASPRIANRSQPASRAGDAATNAAPEDVPLGRLAPCASRSEEDSLKQRVIASANAQGTCASDAGAYRFVESRNLNAFLMLIRRNPHREVANRCEELRFALECLAQQRKEPSES
jgi:hypothetical protein